MKEERSGRWLADVSLLISACMWGINIPVVKFATTNIEPLVFNAVRMVFSALALGLLAWAETRWRPTDWKQVRWRRVFAFSLCSGLLYSLLFMLGIKNTTAANAALLMASMPMWTALLSMIFLKERLPQITWIGLGVTFVGTAIVVGAKGQLSLSLGFLVGNLTILAASMTWATATVISRPLMEKIGPLQLAFISSAMTTPLHLLIAGRGIPEALDQFLTPTILLSVIYSGALSTGLAYATWNLGVQKLGGSHASVYQNVVTLVAVLGGWIVLAEPPLLAQFLGGGLTIAGLFIMRRGRS